MIAQFVVHHVLGGTLMGVGGYRVLKALPSWIARMRLAINRDPRKADRLRKNTAALERPWRWPWQRDD